MRWCDDPAAAEELAQFFAVLDWITAEAMRFGCARLFLESGVQNHRAHEFFEREGFAICSVVMMKPLTPPA